MGAEPINTTDPSSEDPSSCADLGSEDISSGADPSGRAAEELLHVLLRSNAQTRMISEQEKEPMCLTAENIRHAHLK
ncbi:hypothetical protein NDU88_001408 [Pleurodeles waltl]|uniref:Uncharacterized protein n=1 Tax=Pleurodeles waltl TaxID=8319 RepID=A0AAV7Q5Z1_PLEWA|nr:hypothetical protein NDU88_001408 [Pleurodeles waltl]